MPTRSKPRNVETELNLRNKIMLTKSKPENIETKLNLESTNNVN